MFPERRRWNPSVLEQRIGRIYRLGQKARNERRIKFDTAPSFLQRVEALLDAGSLPSAHGAKATKGTLEMEPEPDEDVESEAARTAGHELRAPGAPDDALQQADAVSSVPGDASRLDSSRQQDFAVVSGDGCTKEPYVIESDSRRARSCGA